MTHWTERLYREQADLFASFLARRFDRGAEEATALLDLLESEHGLTVDRVLDVACGIGRHAVAFAEAGCRVHGVDISPTFVERARDRASEAGVADRVEFDTRDMRDAATWEGDYELVTLFWNSLGYYDRATDIEVLSALGALRAEEACLVVELTNLSAALKDFESSRVRELGDRLHVERVAFEPATGRFDTTIEVFSTTETGYEYVDTVEFSPRLYAPVELRELCMAAGFDRVSLYGGFDGADLSIESPRVVAVAE